MSSLLRNKDFESAKYILIERTVLMPHDGQTWLRLARVHRALGNQRLEEEAQYTAWQLGIGQGGFGGSI